MGREKERERKKGREGGKVCFMGRVRSGGGMEGWRDVNDTERDERRGGGMQDTMRWLEGGER